jgi:(p)ppGpp synthase/HD superfamily hydrolase
MSAQEQRPEMIADFKRIFGTFPTAMKALEIADHYHTGQMRKKKDECYIVHPIRVAKLYAWKAIMDLFSYHWDETTAFDANEIEDSEFRDIIEEGLSIALCHDVLEDTSCSEVDLLNAVGERIIVDGVKALSRSKGETYFDFIMRINDSKMSRTVRFVKMSDLEDNMMDLEECSLKDKYRFAHYILVRKLPLLYNREVED